MEILTLIKANIRRKKGSFISVVLLTLIIAMSVTTILSIKESTFKGVDDANKLCDTPNITIMIHSHKYDGKTVEKVRKDRRVKQVNVIDTITAGRVKIRDEEIVNACWLEKADNNTRLLKDNLSGIKGPAPKLNKGEVYVPQGTLTNLHGKIGDKMTFTTISGTYDFTVKGIMLEPSLGSSMIGWKKFCISIDDYNKISADVKKAENKEQHALAKKVEIYKADSCTLTDGQLRRQLNLDTGISEKSISSVTLDMSVNYTTLFPKIVSSILLVFAMFLLAIVVIVTVHSISAEIESNYVTFGVLKAQGFDKNKIRLMFMGQYLFAEIVGAIIGIILSIPVLKITSNIFVTVTAIPAVISVPIGIISIILVSLILFSAAAIFFVTIKVGKISPVRAVSGAKEEIYFDSRLNAPISKRLLSPSLALRQFTSAKRRYIGTFLIVAILVFFMVTVTFLANVINSKSALQSMGAVLTDIDVSPKKVFSDKEFEKVEKEIERFSKIEKTYYLQNVYFSFDGEEIMGCVYKDVTYMPILKGRLPKYDNEIVASPILLDEFKLDIGDEVTIGWNGKKKKYLITGTAQFMNDTGRSFMMSYDASQRIDFGYELWGCYSIEKYDDEKLKEEIVDSLNDKFGDILTASESGGIDDSTVSAVKAMRLIIYVFSSLFALIVVHMVCSKAFVRERTDIGIFKAVGFKTSGLRLQFAVRFLIISVIGSCLGAAAGYFLSQKILVVLLKSLGIVSLDVSMGVSAFVIPILLICVSFFVFSYLVSGKIKKVKIRELIAE